MPYFAPCICIFRRDVAYSVICAYLDVALVAFGLGLIALCCGDSDSQDEYTALLLAAREGHANCLRLLLDAGADKDVKSKVPIIRCFALSLL